MRAVIQRVSFAKVKVDDKIIGQIGSGLLILLGIEDADDDNDLAWLARKITSLRIFSDDDGKMNLDVGEINGEFDIQTIPPSCSAALNRLCSDAKKEGGINCGLCVEKNQHTLLMAKCTAQMVDSFCSKRLCILRPGQDVQYKNICKEMLTRDECVNNSVLKPGTCLWNDPPYRCEQLINWTQSNYEQMKSCYSAENPKCKWEYNTFSSNECINDNNKKIAFLI